MAIKKQPMADSKCKTSIGRQLKTGIPTEVLCLVVTA